MADPKRDAKAAEPPKVGDHGYTPERNEQDPHDGRGEEEAAEAVKSASSPSRR